MLKLFLNQIQNEIVFSILLKNLMHNIFFCIYIYINICILYNIIKLLQKRDTFFSFISFFFQIKIKKRVILFLFILNLCKLLSIYIYAHICGLVLFHK